MLSVSTSWMPEEADVEDWLRQVKDLGFDAIELSYKINEHQLKKFETLIAPMGLTVSSIHNFCPVPQDEPSVRHPSNYYRLSSIDEHERQKAVQWTKTAVDTAEHVGAGVVVIHAGTLDFEDERSPRLFQLYAQGGAGQDEFLQERSRILQLREAKKRPYIAALEQSLNEVLAYSDKKHIKVGLETRYYPIEIPNFEEIGYFIDLFAGSGLGYWHDVGHAEMNSRLGIRAHKDFLRTYQDVLIGVHLHGIKGARDHLAPFEGDMDLQEYLSYFPSHVLKVVESKPFAHGDYMKSAVEKLKG